MADTEKPDSISSLARNSHIVAPHEMGCSLVNLMSLC